MSVTVEMTLVWVKELFAPYQLFAHKDYAKKREIEPHEALEELNVAAYPGSILERQGTRRGKVFFMIVERL